MDKIKKYCFYLSIAIIGLFALYLQTKLYISSSVFEDDECRLALAMMDKNIIQMFLPLGAFSSTPIFMAVSKIIAEITNYSEYALKFLPFVFSVLSLWLFYKICSGYFKRKVSVILGLYLLAVNQHIIYFSSIFKTYSLEILITLLCLYYFPKINFCEFNKKQLVILSAVIAILPLISLPSLFFIGILFLINIYENFKNKDFYKKFALIIVPFLIVFSLYYFVNLLPTKELQLANYAELWENVYSVPFISNIAVILKFLTSPNSYILFTLILVCYSLIFIAVNKNEHTRFNTYIVISPVLSVLVSYFNIYPTLIGRTALFIAPVLFIILIKPIDVLNTKKMSFYIVCALFFAGLYQFFTPSYLNKLNDVNTSFRNFSPKVLIQDIKANYNKQTDNIVTTEASAYSFTFYSIKSNFIITDFLMPKINSENRRKFLFDYYNNLNPNKNYWFYLIKEYEKSPQREYTLEWLKNQNIIYNKKDRDSYLYYISGIRKTNP